MGAQSYKSKDFQVVETKLSAFGIPAEVIKKETAFALQTINNNSKLLQCSKQSILSAIVQAANIGLSLNPAKQECALIPRRTQTGFVCNPMPQYQGLANLACKKGNITQIDTVIVHGKDDIVFNRHDNKEPVKHSHGFSDRGEIVGCYTLFTYKNGDKQVEPMEIEEAFKIREMSDGYQYAKKYGKEKEHPWVIWFSEMFRKACLKRGLKHANTSGADEKLWEAIRIDNADYKPSVNKVGFVERLIDSSTFDDEYKASLENELAFCNDQRANEMIEELQTHQLPAHPGWNEKDGRKKTIGEHVKNQLDNENA